MQQPTATRALQNHQSVPSALRLSLQSSVPQQLSCSLLPIWHEPAAGVRLLVLPGAYTGSLTLFAPMHQPRQHQHCQHQPCQHQWYWQPH